MSDRRARGDLAHDMNTVLMMLRAGELEVTEGYTLTVKYIQNLIVEILGLDAEDAPSTGAINSILKKWDAIGYVTTDTKPFRMVDFTDEGAAHGVYELQRRYLEEHGSFKDLRSDPKAPGSLIARRALRIAQDKKRAREFDELWGKPVPDQTIVDIL
jgi:hypothetical protein